MPIAPPALQLRKQPRLLQALLRLYEGGTPIPPQLLDSALVNDQLLSGLPNSQFSIEREIEHVFSNYHKPTTPQKTSLQKLLKKTTQTRFTFQDKALDAVTVKELYREISQHLQEKEEKITLDLTPEQFAEIRPSIAHIMYFHGNQALTSSPYFLGGIPQVLFFQWGNLLGVAKYTAAPSEMVVKGNLLVYFEDLEERTLEECVAEYQKVHTQMIHELHAPPLLMLKPTSAPNIIIPPPTPVVTVPTLSLRLTPPSPWSK